MFDDAGYRRFRGLDQALLAGDGVAIVHDLLIRTGRDALVNTRRCCEIAASDSRSEPSATPTTDGEPHAPCLQIAGWIVPAAILDLMAKCPACLSADIAIGTGVGLSLSAATRLRASHLLTDRSIDSLD